MSVAVALPPPIAAPPGSPDALRGAARHLAAAADAVTRHHATLAASGNTPTWTGEAADAFRRALAATGDAVAATPDLLHRAAAALDHLAGELAAAQATAGRADAQATDLRARAVTTGRAPSPVGDAERLALATLGDAITRAATGATEQARAATTRARTTFEELAAAADRIRPPAVPGGNPGFEGLVAAGVAGALGAAEFSRRLADPRSVPPGEILREYQVSDDPEGTVMYPSESWKQQFTEPREVTVGEARLLDRLSLIEQKDFADIKGAAFATADERFTFSRPDLADRERNLERNDSHNDAFRHTYWNALLTRRFGSEWTAAYTIAHERLPENPADRESMDLFNNEVGRQIAISHPDADAGELADLVEQAVRSGQTVVIDGQGQLVHSDQVPVHQTGQANDRPNDGLGDIAPPAVPNGPDGGGYEVGNRPS